MFLAEIQVLCHCVCADYCLISVFRDLLAPFLMRITSILHMCPLFLPFTSFLNDPGHQDPLFEWVNETQVMGCHSALIGNLSEALVSRNLISAMNLLSGTPLKQEECLQSAQIHSIYIEEILQPLSHPSPDPPVHPSPHSRPSRGVHTTRLKVYTH